MSPISHLEQDWYQMQGGHGLVTEPCHPAWMEITHLPRLQHPPDGPVPPDVKPEPLKPHVWALPFAAASKMTLALSALPLLCHLPQALLHRPPPPPPAPWQCSARKETPPRQELCRLTRASAVWAASRIFFTQSTRSSCVSAATSRERRDTEAMLMEKTKRRLFFPSGRMAARRDGAEGKVTSGG